jgi:hypothetical protein
MADDLARRVEALEGDQQSKDIVINVQYVETIITDEGREERPIPAT